MSKSYGPMGLHVRARLDWIGVSAAAEKGTGRGRSFPSDIGADDRTAVGCVSLERYAIEPVVGSVARPEEIKPVISRLRREGAQALIVLPGVWLVSERYRIADLALLNQYDNWRSHLHIHDVISIPTSSGKFRHNK